VEIVLVVLACATALAGCGGDRPTKAAFVEHMTSISSTDRSPQWQAIWGCAYGRIADDDTIDQLMALEPGERPAKDLSAQVSDAVVHCVPDQHPTTTTAPPTTVPLSTTPSTTPSTTSLPRTSTGATTSTSAPR
jgi:hypothetical protein